jgi:hypothetical protein
VGFGVAAPLFVLPVTWIIYTYKRDRGDIFMAIFIVMFVTFTIAFANLSQSSSAIEAEKQRLLSACRLFDAIKTQQRVKTSNISKGASLQFKDVWLRDPKD